jgi:hypothetical protein
VTAVMAQRSGVGFSTFRSNRKAVSRKRLGTLSTALHLTAAEEGPSSQPTPLQQHRPDRPERHRPVGCPAGCPSAVRFGRRDRGVSWRSAMGRRQCEQQGCTKRAADGGTPFCIAHGGGKRCQEEGCLKSAQGDTGHCKAHGAGRRCQHKGCIKSAQAGGPAAAPHGVDCTQLLQLACSRGISERSLGACVAQRGRSTQQLV